MLFLAKERAVDKSGEGVEDLVIVAGGMGDNFFDFGVVRFGGFRAVGVSEAHW
tara:strand:- start:106 stop:264 length:159 start_codon:yes stop_codon:yes gene_type:complete